MTLKWDGIHGDSTTDSSSTNSYKQTRCILESWQLIEETLTTLPVPFFDINILFVYVVCNVDLN